MAKESKQILRKSYNSDEWLKVSKSDSLKELSEKEFDILEKKSRVKISNAIYVLK